ncbi:hypothetical protein ACP70R_043949 [Stipagrostis hirtigluma subsp. patula]
MGGSPRPARRRDVLHVAARVPENIQGHAERAARAEHGAHAPPAVPRRGHAAVRSLRLVYRKDVPMECRYADDFITLANAPKLTLHLQCDNGLPDEGAGAWSLKLPPAIAELQVLPHWYSVRLPHMHGLGVNTLRSLTLNGMTMLRQEFLLTGLPSLEDLHISECTLDAGIAITSDSMPRLRHLAITDVSIMTKDTKAAITVLADELTTLRMSCHRRSKTNPLSYDEWFRLPARFRASFTTYASFRLRAPRLRVFEWRCCYADEVRVASVGRLSDVVVELAAGRIPRPYKEESRSVSTEQRDKLMSDILEALMPGLHPRSWANVMRKCVQRDDRWVCFEISSAYSVTE